MGDNDRTSSDPDGIDVSQTHQKREGGNATEEDISSTRRMMNKANDNRVFIGVIVAGLIGIGNLVVMAIQQPLVDDHQTFMIELNATNIVQINGKLDKILDGLP